MQVTRLFDTLYYQAEHFPKEDAIVAKEDGGWRKYSTPTIIGIVNQLSLGLLQLGFTKGDKIGIVSHNRPEWLFADIALSQLGIISVPMYPNATAADYRFIIEDADVKLIFLENREILHKIHEATQGLDVMQNLYTFDDLEEAEHWSKIKALGENQDATTLASHRETIQEDELATLIYTSGTTGRPKGVMLSHKNIISNTLSVAAAFKLANNQYRALSFLPLCHIFERTASNVYFFIGISIYFAESMDTIVQDMNEVRPHLFSTVPRLLEKVYDKIMTKGYELKGVKRNIFFWAMKLAQRYEIRESQPFWYGLQLQIADKLVFSKWRAALGGNIKFIVSGAAALQPRLTQIFWAAGIRVTEAYGMTETSPGISFTLNNPNDARIGCVGPLLQGVRVKIAEDGEILVKGDNVMMGYYNRPEQSRDVFDEEGWFRTGDIGEMVEERFLKITDRKKEIFKTSGGKYIAPQVLENTFKESMFIEYIMVVGEGEKFPAAFIVPSFEYLEKWCTSHDIPYTGDEEMIQNEKILNRFDSERVKYNKGFARYEQIKKFKLLHLPWTIDSGELTPTLKLRRKVILEKYKQQLAEFYRE